jgi:hypothetical protein
MAHILQNAAMGSNRKHWTIREGNEIGHGRMLTGIDIPSAGHLVFHWDEPSDGLGIWACHEYQTAKEICDRAPMFGVECYAWMVEADKATLNSEEADVYEVIHS